MDPFGAMIRLMIALFGGMEAMQGAYYIVQSCHGTYGIVAAITFMVMVVYTIFMVLLR